MNDRFKKIRKQKKLTQRQYGEILGLSQNHISSLEKGERNITDRIIKDLNVNLNVNPEWIKEGKGEMFMNPIDSLNIEDPEVKDFMNLYAQLDETTREHVRNLVESALKLKK